jgi:hypothetical protein
MHQRAEYTQLRGFSIALLATIASCSPHVTSAPQPAPADMLAGTHPAPALTPVERTIVDAVDPRNAEGLALLERLVNINSGTMNFAGVRQVGGILRTELDSLGSRHDGRMEPHWVAQGISSPSEMVRDRDCFLSVIWIQCSS